MDGKIFEQRVYCKIRAQLEFPPTEIHAGWESIENDPRVGRPVSVSTEKNVATVKTLIEEDACYAVQEIEELSGIQTKVF